MFVKEFDYHLPPELIARHPLSERDASRLMVVNRQECTIHDDHFRNLAAYFRAGDLLVMNDTRVIPARLFGHKPTGGKVEIFLVRREEGQRERWSCLIRGSKGLREESCLAMQDGMCARIISPHESDSWLVEFEGTEPFDIWLQRVGQMPLPPYLQRPADDADRERYQTVFAAEPGAVAAPTAGLHFTPQLLAELAAKGVTGAQLTLHTGLGTFQPVRVERVADHRIHTERYSISAETADLIAETRSRGGRIIAVGTTTARTLEFAADVHGRVHPGSGEADIFIYPGYHWKVVDALVTNFHLPESTLIMLVSAFAGKELVFEAYDQAVRRGYRFYSYGDAMLLF